MAARRARRPRKVALVTGAAVRLGRALAEALAEDGYDLVLHHRRSHREAETLARRLQKGGARTLVLPAELSDPEAIEALFGAIDGSFKRLDLLVNSAASFERVDFLDLDPDRIERMIASNLIGPMLLCLHAARRMGGQGNIVNMLDLGGGLQAWRGYAHYCAAKAGLAMLTRCLALDLAPGIRVNGIAPGTVLFPESYGGEERRRVTEQIPLGRIGHPRDVVRALRYLLDAEFVTGTVAVVDGGRSLGKAASGPA